MYKHKLINSTPVPMQNLTNTDLTITSTANKPIGKKSGKKVQAMMTLILLNPMTSPTAPLPMTTPFRSLWIVSTSRSTPSRNKTM